MIDKSKQYRTRDGREVRIYATDGDGEFRIHGAIRNLRGGWEPRQWPGNGKIDAKDFPVDLIEVKPRIKRKVWVNVYRGGESEWMTIHDKRDEADDYPDCYKMRIACVEIDIDVEEGHGR